MKLFIFLTALWCLTPAFAVPSILGSGEEEYLPDCRLITHQMDQVWYIPKKMEIDKLPVEGRNIIRIRVNFARGSCREMNYSRYTPAKFEFFPGDAWPLEPKGVVKKPLASFMKASTLVEYGDVLQNVTSLIMDRDKLVEELTVSKKRKMKVSYLLNGLYAGFYYDHYKFINMTYHFELREDGLIWIHVTL